MSYDLDDEALTQMEERADHLIGLDLADLDSLIEDGSSDPYEEAQKAAIFAIAREKGFGHPGRDWDEGGAGRILAEGLVGGEDDAIPSGGGSSRSCRTPWVLAGAFAALAGAMLCLRLVNKILKEEDGSLRGPFRGTRAQRPGSQADPCSDSQSRRERGRGACEWSGHIKRALAILV